MLYICLILRILANPFSNLLQKKLTTNGRSCLLVNFLTYFMLSLVCLIFVKNIDLLHLSKQFWLYSFCGAFIGALGNACLIKSLQNGELSILGPINSYKAIVSVFFAWFLLKETPSLIAIAGILFILLGSYFIFDTIGEKFSFHIFKRSDIQFRVLALFLTAIEAVFIKKIILLSSVSIAFVMWCCLGAVFAFLYALPSIKRRLLELNLKDYFLVSLIAVLVGTMQLSTNYIFSKMNVSYALALFQMSMLVNVFLGHKFFGETKIVKKIIATFVMIFGAILIIIF